MHYKTTLSLISIIMLLGGCSGSSSSSSHRAIGVLDTSFNGAGIVVDANASGTAGADSGYAVVTDSNGKILVTGHSPNASGDLDMLIWRYENNGTLDTTFGTSGYVFHDNAAGGSSDDAGHGMIIDSNGKILVTGISTNGSGNVDMAIWRYEKNGTLDTAFGSSGYVVHDNAAGGSGHDYGRSITIDGNGKIVVAGYSQNASANLDMTIWRYNSNGTIDSSFGTSGYIVHDNAAGGLGDDDGSAIAIDDKGNILVAGYSTGSTDCDMVIWRYDSNGILDTTFNGSGIVTHDNAAGGSGNDYARAIVVDNRGKIIVTGASTTSKGDLDMLIWRYEINGTLDTSFGTTGYVKHDSAAGGSSHDYGHAIVLDVKGMGLNNSSGKILVAGYSTNANGDQDLAVWRYNSNGDLDPTFNISGFLTHDSAAGGSSNDYGNAIALDNSGNLLVAGQSRSADGTDDMVIWRYR